MQEQDFTLNVLPKVTYSTSALPQTAHPFDKRVDMQAYRLAGDILWAASMGMS